jgi:hypothetical protein
MLLENIQEDHQQPVFFRNLLPRREVGLVGNKQCVCHKQIRSPRNIHGIKMLEPKGTLGINLRYYGEVIVFSSKVVI